MGLEPGYVLDRMEFYEMEALFINRHLREREKWEMARMQAFVTARCAGADIKQPKELFSFPWEKETSDKPVRKEISPKDEERVKATARYFLKEGWLG